MECGFGYSKTMSKSTSLALLLMLPLAILSASRAHANGLAGQRLEKNIGAYVIDIGTDQEFTPQAGAPVRFDFQLLDTATRQLVPFTDVNVFFSLDGRPLLDGDLVAAQNGPTFLTYNFPQNGTYTFQVAFYKSSKELGTAEFPLVIGSGNESSSGGGGSTTRSFVLGSIIGILLGAFFGAEIVLRFRKQPGA